MTDLKRKALDYHRLPRPGKIEVALTKPCETQEDLSLAYTPGVAQPVLEIEKDPLAAYEYTNKGNLVGVISNGSAILGLGNRGALASKPVMEGKAMLFKRFANVDAFDIEIDAPTVEAMVETVARMAPTFGGINLEDIKAPECFEVERQLQEKLDIPVFHDDQHGTAIIAAAGLLNALEIQSKTLEESRIVCVGAGAAGIAILQLLLALGARKENIALVDSKGVVHSGRDDLNPYKAEFALDTSLRTLEDALKNADVFIGVSQKDLLKPEWLKTMAPKPIVFAMANPDPEIRPEVALAARDDVIMATGRSDYPNQVNNVLGFPFIFRGALDARASEINMTMKIAAVKALSELARQPVPQVVLDAYGLESLEFGPDYIIPKPTDPRLLDVVPKAVYDAAVASGVARI
ncbi:malate dehydrogenase (oxaloacetate-decarboxylating)(NADP+) [Sulfurivirga caldicuralii]|uniref:NADP-dependent malic enzyme n=1 Tax=Sulfurivirga caldicuralii TaxID=364032 RepID=A0A1N6HI71_9GAMM|nr:malic enzyme-like NAD(P)-binding protein [Sulfurivirga caldicuralii]SIO19426.1 malate dehydrogenase (oxaloacetate-decarboxylating)(NADP+) [Sulfurivirga caldicuralii]